MNKPNLCKMVVGAVFVVALTLSPFALAHDPAEHGKENLSAGAEKTVTGEIVDMMCYVDQRGRRRSWSILRCEVYQKRRASGNCE